MPNDDEESQEAISGERKTRESMLRISRWRNATGYDDIIEERDPGWWVC
jgi:hypothetical protein